MHAEILLLADQAAGDPAWNDECIAQAVGVAKRTVEHVRQRLVDLSLETALERKKRETPVELKLTGDKEARIIALACSPAPEGRVCWIFALFAEKIGGVERIRFHFHNKRRHCAQKNEFQPHRKKCWCIPERQNVEFVARMGNALDVYQRLLHHLRLVA